MHQCHDNVKMLFAMQNKKNGGDYDRLQEMGMTSGSGNMIMNEETMNSFMIKGGVLSEHE